MSFDARQTPARPDLAAGHLKGQVEAARFVDGQTLQVSVPVLDMASAPGAAALSSQLLFGERFEVYATDPQNGLAWGQSVTDGYVGYVNSQGLGPAGTATHRVATRSAQTYADPELKRVPLMTLPWMAQVTVEAREAGYVRIADGQWLPETQIGPLSETAPDYVSVAETLIGAPYIWGGRSALGLDCSALVQLALAAAGTPFPRDSDQQQAAAQPITPPLSRGDLVFWRGHVGIMQDATRLLHANAHH
ncbi:MAG: NlpC/P60 family protein, partial [Pseudomonadota bacterium]